MASSKAANHTTATKENTMSNPAARPHRTDRYIWEALLPTLTTETAIHQEGTTGTTLLSRVAPQDFRGFRITRTEAAASFDRTLTRTRRIYGIKAGE